MSVVTALWHCGDDSSPPTHTVLLGATCVSPLLSACVSVWVCLCVCVWCVCVCVSHSFTLTHSFPLTHSHSLTSTHLSNHIFISPLIVSLIFTYACCVVCVFGGCMGEACVDCHSPSLIHPPSLRLTSQPTPTPSHTLCVCCSLSLTLCPLTFVSVL